MLLKKRMMFGLALLVAVFMGRGETGLMDGNVLSLAGGSAGQAPQKHPALHGTQTGPISRGRR